MPATPKAQMIAFALGLKEATFGTAIANASLTTWIPASEVDFPKLDIAHFDDSKHINNKLGATKRQIQKRSGTRSWKFDASAETLTWATAIQIGVVTMAGVADPFSATIKFRDVCTINPPSFTYFHGLNCAGMTGTYFVRKGAVIDQQTIEISGKGPVRQTLTIKDDGTLTAAPSFSVPTTESVVKHLFAGNTTVQLGPVGSLVNLSTAKTLREAKIAINSNIADIEVPNSTTNVDEYQYGEDSPTIELDLVVKGDESSALFSNFTALDVVQLIVDIDPVVTPARSFKLTMTNAHVIDVAMRPQGNETQLQVKLGPLYTATDAGVAQFLGKTAQATFLVGA